MANTETNIKKRSCHSVHGHGIQVFDEKKTSLLNRLDPGYPAGRPSGMTARKAFTSSLSRKVSVRSIGRFVIPRTTTLRGDGVAVHAFTLIELLVVVLIIGILSAIALPQYQRAVEKARLREALLNIDMIQKAMEIYRLQYGGFPSNQINLKDVLETSGTELSNGEWDDNFSYFTKNFEFWGGCTPTACHLCINRLGGKYYLELNQYVSSQTKICATNNTDIGEKICNQFKAQGWEYYEGEL